VVPQLIAAIKSNDTGTVQRLAKTRRVLNVNVDLPTNDDDDDGGRGTYILRKWTAVHECVRGCHVETLEIIIEHGANV
jgi:hypothetical protein